MHMTAHQIKAMPIAAAIKAAGFDAVFSAYTYGVTGETSARQSHLSRAWHAGMLGRTAGGLGVVGPVSKLPA
jgi:hypothetical protein